MICVKLAVSQGADENLGALLAPQEIGIEAQVVTTLLTPCLVGQGVAIRRAVGILIVDELDYFIVVLAGKVEGRISLCAWQATSPRQ